MESQNEESVEEAESDVIKVKDPVELLSKAIKQIAKKTGDEWVVKAAIRPVVKRLDPTFDESNYECKTFAELLKKYPKSFKIKQGEHDHLVSLTG